MVVDEDAFASTAGMAAFAAEWRVGGLNGVSCRIGGANFSRVILMSFLFLRNCPVSVSTI